MDRAHAAQRAEMLGIERQRALERIERRPEAFGLVIGQRQPVPTLCELGRVVGDIVTTWLRDEVSSGAVDPIR